MKTTLSRFRRDEAGYVTALALISMPLLLGFSLLVIDVGRGNNLQTDLQNAVDAIALAGARELNGGEDSIDRAEAAMTDLLNNQARMGDNGTVAIGADEVNWLFFEEIPADDDTQIDPEEATTDPFRAAYVWVWADSQPMTSLFPLPTTLASSTIDVTAHAVATYDVGACDVTPIFVCNPFEDDGSGLSFQEAFAAGKLYSRVLTLHIGGGSTIGPGNYGWLNFAGTGGDALRDALATGKSGECYGLEQVETKPGATVGAADQGMNVRFGIYAGSMSPSHATRPALNVRKGAKEPNKCNKYDEQTNTSLAMALPSASISGGTYGSQTLAGGTLSGDNWDLPLYWGKNHPGQTQPTARTSDPAGKTTGHPSRYDVYQYEIAAGRVNDAAPNGETGNPAVCYSESLADEDEDRRIIFAAVADCNDLDLNGSSTIDNPIAFVSMFLTKPMISSGSDKVVSAEIVDVTGFSGLGTLETVIREESSLVR